MVLSIRSIIIRCRDQNALGGVLPADVFQDACQLEESYSLEQNKWREWSLTSTDGDTAALLQLISDHKIDFEFNTNHAKASRLLMEGNSKKAGSQNYCTSQ